MTTSNNTRPQFRADNTRGYNPAQLAALNSEYERRALAQALSPSDEDSVSLLAEQVLADYDASRVTDETETETETETERLALLREAVRRVPPRHRQCDVAWVVAAGILDARGATERPDAEDLARLTVAALDAAAEEWATEQAHQATLR